MSTWSKKIQGPVPRRTGKYLFILVWLIALLALFPSPPTPANAQGEGTTIVASAPAAKRVQPNRLASPPVPAPDTLRRMQALKDRTHLRGPRTPQGARTLQAPPAMPLSARPQTLPKGPLDPTSFVVYTNTDVCGTNPACNASVIAEPSAANLGPNLFESYNWYAGLSTDGGATFGFVDPKQVLPDGTGYGFFCCDQMVVSVPAYTYNRDLFFWSLLSVNESGGLFHGNTIRLAVANSENALKNLDLYYYDFTTEAIYGSTWQNHWYDYPHLELSSHYLYISTNVFDTNAVFEQTVILRLPLDSLAQDVGFSYSIYALGTNPDNPSARLFNATLTQGATDTMYWATHISTSKIRVYRWPESRSGGPDTWSDVTHTYYPDPLPANYTCPGPGGRDWCGRLDDRVLAGWTSKGVLGFMWNAPKGLGGYSTTEMPQPYIQVLLINQTGLSKNSETIIYSNDRTFIYPSAGVNGRGHIGGTLFYGSSTEPPTVAAFLWDDLTAGGGYPSLPSGSWPLYTIVASTQGPTENKWGDYLTTRRNYGCDPCLNTWVGTGYTLVHDGTSDQFRPRVLIFGRQRDDPATMPWGYQRLPFLWR